MAFAILAHLYGPMAKVLGVGMTPFTKIMREGGREGGREREAFLRKEYRSTRQNGASSSAFDKSIICTCAAVWPEG